MKMLPLYHLPTRKNCLNLGSHPPPNSDLRIFEGFFKTLQDRAFCHSLAHNVWKNLSEVNENFTAYVPLVKELHTEFWKCSGLSRPGLESPWRKSALSDFSCYNCVMLRWVDLTCWKTRRSSTITWWPSRTCCLLTGFSLRTRDSRIIPTTCTPTSSRSTISDGILYQLLCCRLGRYRQPGLKHEYFDRGFWKTQTPTFETKQQCCDTITLTI